MKKRIGLLIPVLLCGAVFWAIQARWKRIEADFRAALLQEYADSGARGIEVMVGNGQREKSLGFLSRAEAQSLAPRLFLQKALSSTGSNSPEPSVRFEGEAVDLSVSLGEVRDQANDGRASYGWGGSRQNLQLTPASRRAVREWVQRRWKRETAVLRGTP